jgi:hypothetical protein
LTESSKRSAGAGNKQSAGANGAPGFALESCSKL